jgi:hypothetical protein
MTAFLLLYYALLVLWLPLLWPALHLYGRKRGWLLAIAGAGLLATVNEVWQTVWAVNAIRLDVLLFSVVLTLLYAAAAGILYGAFWRRLAVVLGVALALIAGGMTYQWAMAGREGKRLTAAFDARNALLFRAKFRDQAAYDAYFGPFAPDSPTRPSGHWQTAGGPSHFTRLIVNGEGRAWLFYRCGETECAFGPTGAGLQRGVDAARAEIGWQTVLRPSIGDALPVRLVRDGIDGLRVEARGQAVAFVKAPPPVAPDPPAKSLVFLGSFAAAECLGAHSRVRQVWLWEGEGRMLAVGVFQTLLAGQRAHFVLPVVLGEGRKAGDGWAFTWQRDGRLTTATVTATDAGATLAVAERDRPPEQATLPRAAIFQDEAIDLAPLTGAADWHHWFASVLVASFFSADIPPCK